CYPTLAHKDGTNGCPYPGPPHPRTKRYPLPTAHKTHRNPSSHVLPSIGTTACFESVLHWETMPLCSSLSLHPPMNSGYSYFILNLPIRLVKLTTTRSRIRMKIIQVIQTSLFLPVQCGVQ